MQKITYRDSGVDLETYQESMARLPRLLKKTHCPRVIPWNNGFAGLFRLDFTGKLFSRKYQDPVLVAGTDGVGTKLKVAQMTGCHDTIGIDLVAMCVNDAICCGAEPLFFLDYVAMAEDDPPLLEQLVTGISAGCLQSDAALIGGETAIMPDVYGQGDYDLAGFCVGIVEGSRLIDGKAIAAGSVNGSRGEGERGCDTVLGIASSGIHANGFSLVRKIVFEHAGLSLDDHVELCGQTVGELLMEPTRIYAQPIRAVLSHYKVKSVVHGIAHITGGGLHENLSRILPSTVAAEIYRDSWPIPSVFPWLQQLGRIDDAEMYRVFNMGIGMVLVTSEYYTESIQQQLATFGLESWVIGRIVDCPGGADSGQARWG
jgi:phosphoribosylformylglycinamidine cyclo-ligase